jgi:PKD domain-containing protein
MKRTPVFAVPRATTKILVLLFLAALIAVGPAAAITWPQYNWTCYESGGDCYFTAVTGADVTSYQWLFGDGGTGSGSSVSHSYSSAPQGWNTFYVTLKIWHVGDNYPYQNTCAVTFFKTAVGGSPISYSGSCL